MNKETKDKTYKPLDIEATIKANKAKEKKKAEQRKQINNRIIHTVVRGNPNEPA